MLIDYEWCLDFPIPKDFVIYRCIINLYKLHPDFEQFVTFDKVVDYLNFDINKDLLKNFGIIFIKELLRHLKAGRAILTSSPIM